MFKKPYKDKRFSIAVFDYGEYSCRENKSTITKDELKSFLKAHDLFCDESFKFAANSEIKNRDNAIKALKLQVRELEKDRAEMKEALICVYHNSRANYISPQEREKFKECEKLIEELKGEK